MNRKKDPFDQAVESLREIAVPPGPSDELIGRTLKRIEQAQNKDLSRDAGRKRFIMKSIKRLSIAAVLVFGVCAVLLFNWAPDSIALADVYTLMQQSKAFRYNMSGNMTGMPGIPAQTVEVDMTVTMSDDFGIKMDQTTFIPEQNQTIHQQMYILPAERVIMIVMPDQKSYTQMEFSDDLLQNVNQQNNDPRDMVRQIMDSDYVSLGSAVIDGVRVEGFETTDPAYGGGIGYDVRATLWVDSDTGFPVIAEMAMALGDGMEMDVVLSDFQWDIYVQAEDFIPLLPDDYEEITGIKMPEMNEEAAIEGLALFAELSGSYPSQLETMQLTRELIELQHAQTEAAQRFREKLEEAQTPQQAAVLAQETMMPVQSLGLFYMMLVQQQRDVAYYGRQVTPGDADIVLLRWKTDDGAYRAIFGDLSIAEMDYEDLIWLEPQVEAAP